MKDLVEQSPTEDNLNAYYTRTEVGDLGEGTFTGGG